LENQLAQFDLFRGLPETSLENLTGKLKVVRLEPGQVLFGKGDPGDSVYIVKSGKLKVVSKDNDGNEVILNQVDAGAIIGEMSLLDHGLRSAGITALTHATLLMLSRGDFLDVVEHQPQMGLEISRGLIQRLRFATTYIENAIEWSQLIAKGDYSFIDSIDAPDIEGAGSDQERAARFLGAFFKMVEEIRAREDELKQELVRLKIEIDQTRRQQEVAEIAQSDFFKSIQEKKRRRRGDGDAH
jgi:CRP-like cAMP-binding protein